MLHKHSFRNGKLDLFVTNGLTLRSKIKNFTKNINIFEKQLNTQDIYLETEFQCN